LAMIVVSLASTLVEGGVVEVGAVDEEFTRAASVLTGAGGAGFLSLAEVEDSLVAEIVSLVASNSETVAGARVIVDDLEEVTTLLSDVVETGVAEAESVDVGPLEVAVEVEEVVEVGTTSVALVAEVLDLVMVKEVS